MPLKRALQPMPGFVAEALEREALRALYDARPDYQRNDYLGWIGRAKREETRAKRLRQMMEELRKGDVYMNMKWNGG